jgi:hypothetical protein
LKEGEKQNGTKITLVYVGFLSSIFSAQETHDKVHYCLVYGRNWNFAEPEALKKNS